MAESDLATTLSFMLGSLPEVSVGTHLHNRNFLVGKKVFAFMKNGGVALKLPRPKAQELVANNQASTLVMGKRAMKEWVVIVYEDPEEATKDLELFRESIAYVATQK